MPRQSCGALLGWLCAPLREEIIGGDGHAVYGQREGVTRRRKATCPTPSAAVGVLRIWEGGEVEEGGVVWSGWVDVWRGQPNEGHVDKCMEANKQGSGKQHS